MGKWISYPGGEDRFHVIGVVKDFHVFSVRYDISPIVFFLTNSDHRYLSIKMNTEDFRTTIKDIEMAWKRINPAFPFEFTFLDAQFERFYRSEESTRKLIGYFSFLAVFISCLGLFGMSMFSAEQRIKEIGIRKVLGASVRDITTLLSGEFVKWVVLANIIAIPISYFAMKNWLQGFAYRINPSVGVFVLAAFLSLCIAAFTVSFQAIKAAVSNPIDVLKVE